MTEEKLYITLEDGKELWTNDMTETVKNWAEKKWKLKDIRVFLVKDGKYSTYIVVKGQNVTFESQSYESICAHVDYLGLREREW